MEIRIVCAALRLEDGTIIPSIRHFDRLSINLIKKYNINTKNSMQGFVDNKGNFLTRKEALLIAEKENQIIRRCGGDVELYSENLY